MYQKEMLEWLQKSPIAKMSAPQMLKYQGELDQVHWYTIRCERFVQKYKKILDPHEVSMRRMRAHSLACIPLSAGKVIEHGLILALTS